MDRSTTSTPLPSEGSPAVEPTAGVAAPSQAPEQAKATVQVATGSNEAASKAAAIEAKKKATAEKLARRQKAIAGREVPAESLAGQSQGFPQGQRGGQSPAQGHQGKARRPSANERAASGASVAKGSPSLAAQRPRPVAESQSQDEKTVAVFGHLDVKRRSTIAGAGKDIHPSILALGMQMSEYVICGSSARCVATLLAFKRVIESYVTPPKTSLSRNLTAYLSHQINYLTLCRPLSVSQGNAIRAIKLAIASIDPSVPDKEAKFSLTEYIDQYIRERITVAGQVIANSAASKIQNGDVIATFGNSHCVQKALLLAHAFGKRFTVVVIDTRPLFEGKALAKTLADAGLSVRYSLISNLHHAMRDVRKVFLGAHAVMTNGNLYARVGSAMVAMAAKDRLGAVHAPIIVCCETMKFTDRVTLDSIVLNEIAPPDELVSFPTRDSVMHVKKPAEKETQKGGKQQQQKGRKGSNQQTQEDEKKSELAELVPDSNHPLKYWRLKPNVQLLNIMYDVTPKEYIDLVITEMGSLPPSAVPIVHRMSTQSAEAN